MQLYKQKMSFADSVLRENNQTNSLVISERKIWSKSQKFL